LIGVHAPTALIAQDTGGESSTVQQSEDIQPVEQTLDISLPHSNYVEKFLAEQRQLWESPSQIKRRDVKWLLPLGAGAAALLATDRKVSDAAARNAETLQPPSRFISNIGNGAALGIASGGMFMLGKLTHNERAADTGKLAGVAILHTQLVIQAMKIAFNRERPDKIGGDGSFWNGGRSFPSGHAASAFAFATIVADRYKNKFAVFGAYGLATAVSMSRIGGLNHHPSDVLIGAAIGHLIGRFVLHRHPAGQ